MVKITQDALVSAGNKTDEISVKISQRIIQLFSEGLYSSPHKAIEELVSNSFDAGAQNVHVILSPDLMAPEATIAVVDDGESMDADGLKQHWIIGQSKRREGEHPQGRRPIGKFGIGKLATYVLAERLTHICKSNGIFYAATMDYSKVISPEDGLGVQSDAKGIFNDQNIKIPLRVLTEPEAKKLLATWTTSSSKPGYKALKLFGDDAAQSWTVAIMSRLKDMGKKIQRNRLNWILRTAMPLRDDFRLYYDGELMKPSKIEIPLIQNWVVGKDITGDTLSKPCPTGLVPTEDENLAKQFVHGLSHDKLGRITGYVELYQDDINGGKSEEIERSNGFFVYVRERLINSDDPGFGIERNLLRHGTFSKFRAVIHIDSLDEALRSSRESLQQGELFNLAKDFTHAVFNLVRNRLEEWERSKAPGKVLASRMYSAPGSLTRQPLLALLELGIAGKAAPRYMRFPGGLTSGQRTDFLKKVVARADSEAGLLTGSVLVELDTRDGLAILDMESGNLQINASHPFVAAFHGSFANSTDRLPLEIYAMTEILMEARLYQAGLDDVKISEILEYRDELLRYFVRHSARRTAGMISLALRDAKDDANQLEEEMRASFEAIGFANVIRLGGSGKPDGTAEAYLAASEPGIVQRYKVGMEAKSGGTVAAHRLGVSGIARHMEEYKCDHHLVIGNGFQTSGKDAATITEINEHKKNTKGRTITLMYIDDLARLVRIVPAKRVGLKRLRELFRNCITPEESKAWIDGIEQEQPRAWPYLEILETIWQRANSRPNEPVEYGAVATALEFRNPPIFISKQDLMECCKTLQSMATNMVFARENTVELDRRPDLVLDDIQAAINSYPEEERKTIKI
ncbi:MAG: ATP-binding protein [Dehalococcoidia bacterium]|nr:ATP-binding protein [Dehalococcoidia bacterium]